MNARCKGFFPITMNLKNTEFIIVELIPTAKTREKGELLQLSALKLKGLQLEDRFDYRLQEEKIPIPEFISLINYDKDSFTYLETTEEILSAFTKWSNNLPLLILDNSYTKNFLKDIPNPKESILHYLDKEYHDNIIEELINEYHLEPSNYIVDLLYESLLKHL